MSGSGSGGWSDVFEDDDLFADDKSLDVRGLLNMVLLWFIVPGLFVVDVLWCSRPSWQTHGVLFPAPPWLVCDSYQPCDVFFLTCPSSLCSQRLVAVQGVQNQGRLHLLDRLQREDVGAQ